MLKCLRSGLGRLSSSKLSNSHLIFGNSSWVRSAGRISYREAQNVLDGKPLSTASTIPEHDTQDIRRDIMVLFDLARQLRLERMRNGALIVDSMRLKFQLDDNGLPTDCREYDKYDSNTLVEEVS